MTRSAVAYVRAALVGGTLALAVEVTLLLSGGPLLGYEILGDVFDAQARSFLDLRWDVDPDVMKIEGFDVDGRTYTYFGPVPALLRLPIVAVTDAFDGRLTRASMLVAWSVTVAMSARLAWRARRVVREPEEEADRFEQLLVGLFVFAVGAGSSVTYLTSRPSVFHEAIAWGVAVSLVAIDAVLGWSERRGAMRFAIAVALATVALLTRASVGAAPSLAIGFVLLGEVLRGVRGRDLALARRAVALGCALVIPLAAYAAVNHARFGTAFTLPYERHRVSMVVEHRRDVLQANGGTIQGPQFLPTTTLHYLRPDALGVDGSFPWIDFPRPATVIGDVLMDQVDVASSLPSSMPALWLLAAVGALAVARDRRRRRFGSAIGGTGGCLVVTLAIGFVAHRYTADAVPLLVVAGGVGVSVLASMRSKRGVVLVAGALLVVASAAITSALTVQFQQHYGFLTPPGLRATLAERQLRLPTFGNEPRVLRAEGALPKTVAPDRTFVIVGDCAGVYRSDGLTWQPIEGTARTGHHRVRVRPGSAPVRLVAGITVTWTASEVVVARGQARSRPLPTDGRDAILLDVVADPLLGFVDVRHEGESVLSDYYLDPRPGEAIPEDERVDVLPTPTPLCYELEGRSS